MKNKKGNLLPEETLKIVIAVICIVFLVFLLVSLYFSLTGEEKKKEAAAIMKGDNGLAKEIEKINAGGVSSEQGFLIPNPSGWYIFSFTGEEKKPNLCTQGNCVCICQNILINLFDRQIKECDKKGSCNVFQYIKPFEKIKIENNGVYLSIKKINNLVEITKK